MDYYSLSFANDQSSVTKMPTIERADSALPSPSPAPAAAVFDNAAGMTTGKTTTEKADSVLPSPPSPTPAAAVVDNATGTTTTTTTKARRKAAVDPNDMPFDVACVFQQRRAAHVNAKGKQQPTKITRSDRAVITLRPSTTEADFYKLGWIRVFELFGRYGNYAREASAEEFAAMSDTMSQDSWETRLKALMALNDAGKDKPALTVTFFWEKDGKVMFEEVGEAARFKGAFLSKVGRFFKKRS